MNKTKLLKLTNIILMISFVIQVMTSMILYFHLFDSHPHLFKIALKTHMNNGMLLIAVAFVHLILNWGWVRSSLLKRKKEV
jgi:hypothetical protein